jgi:hypothetical protein
MIEFAGDDDNRNPYREEVGLMVDLGLESELGLDLDLDVRLRLTLHLNP